MAKKDTKISANHSSNDRMSRGDIAFEWVNCIILGIVACIMLFPLIYVVSASFSDPMSVTSGKMILWPVDVTLENYKEVFKNDNIMRGYRNSLAIMFLGTALNLVMTILAAFPMSRPASSAVVLTVDDNVDLGKEMQSDTVKTNSEKVTKQPTYSEIEDDS